LVAEGDRMGYSASAWERAMKVQEVILKAISGEIHWFRAADILGVSPRTLRRYRVGLEKHGYTGLMDRRRHTPSLKRAASEEVSRILELYRERYTGWNVSHFHETVKREHGVKLGYTFVRKALQTAGLVKKHKSRGRHRRRRERRACFGELLHIDGSRHGWLGLVPDERQTLIAIVDDATSRLLYAQLWPAESTQAVMTAVRDVVVEHGIPASIYSDRASWAFETSKAGGKVSKTHLTQFGRALERLGVEHIPSYSPQARGRSERMNGTLQGRLVNELKVAGATTLAAANKYIRRNYMATHNEKFSCAPRDVTSAFVACADADLDQIFCTESVRTVAKDNTITCGKVVLQISRQPNRRTCAGLAVTLREHLDGRWSLWRGQQLLGRYEPNGRPMDAAGPVESRKRPRLSTRTLDRRPTDAGAPQRPQAPASNL
jgi:transposase